MDVKELLRVLNTNDEGSEKRGRNIYVADRTWEDFQAIVGEGNVSRAIVALMEDAIENAKKKKN